MNTYADKKNKNKSQAFANSLTKQKGNNESTFQFEDKRPENIAQRKLQEAVNNSLHVQQLKAYQEMASNRSSIQNTPIQKKENDTGLPDNHGTNNIFSSTISTNAHNVAQKKLSEVVYSNSRVVQRYKVFGAEETYPEGSVRATKDEIFRWLNGEEMWSKVSTEWYLVGGSAHVEIVEYLLSSNFEGVVNALVKAMGLVPPKDKETSEEYIHFFVDKVMTTEDLDIGVSNPDVANQFPVNQSETQRLLCTDYQKQGVDLLRTRGEKKFQLPNGVWVVAPESLLDEAKTGMAGILAGIGAKKPKEAEDSEKDRKRTARKGLMKSVIEQGLLKKE